MVLLALVVLQKPDLPDDVLAGVLREAYGLQAAEVTFQRSAPTATPPSPALSLWTGEPTS
jgi:hypothetical protein